MGLLVADFLRETFSRAESVLASASELGGIGVDRLCNVRDVVALGVDKGGRPRLDVCCHRALRLARDEIHGSWGLGCDTSMVLQRVCREQALVALVLLPVVLLRIRLEI